MAFRSPIQTLLRNGLKGNRTCSTTASVNMKIASTNTIPPVVEQGRDKVATTVKKHGDFVPVYVTLGLIVLSMSFGLHVAKQQLLYSPTVHVKKSRRETLPDVEDPDAVLDEAEKFIKKSFFRKVAHVQEFNHASDPNRGDVLSRPLKAETLKSVGVNPELPKVHTKPSPPKNPHLLVDQEMTSLV